MGYDEEAEAFRQSSFRIKSPKRTTKNSTSRSIINEDDNKYDKKFGKPNIKSNEDIVPDNVPIKANVDNDDLNESKDNHNNNAATLSPSILSPKQINSDTEIDNERRFDIMTPDEMLEKLKKEGSAPMSNPHTNIETVLISSEEQSQHQVHHSFKQYEDKEEQPDRSMYPT